MLLQTPTRSQPLTRLSSCPGPAVYRVNCDPSWLVCERCKANLERIGELRHAERIDEA
jgi:hypothetical protein